MISIQKDDFDPGFEQDQLSDNTGTGALVTFTGLVRDENLGDDVGGLYLEHYPGMTEKSLRDIIDEAAERWPLQAIRVIHRVGQLQPGDRIVFVGVASAHRKAAFEICEFVMDYLKTRAPFWKKETTPEGDRWVDARESDEEAAKRWGQTSL
ncbi:MULTISPECIES: molybdopterin synthase catalytic subunit MoaE [unclassified Endozoicomonas]|uniref:molybdopterin synthase catalytic subunit MoaE n=1 Tax=unclassified Endozoicomonas TaxID=2644528 RepID=UPI002148E7C5|nr:MULTISPECIES: molybdopterin synthase catalytic subunit MoaE [unclassified Endozoicomonas]